MKKLIILLSVLIASIVTVNAQHGSLEQKSAFRKVSDIEKNILDTKSDTTAARLIMEHKKAKQAMQHRLSKVEGYGKVKKDKPSIDKFKVKAAKKDAKFAKLNQREQAADKKKKDYISSINPDYKAALPKAFPNN